MVIVFWVAWLRQQRRKLTRKEEKGHEIYISTRDLIETLCKIIEYESAFCQGTYSTFILDKMNPEVERQYNNFI